MFEMRSEKHVGLYGKPLFYFNQHWNVKFYQNSKPKISEKIHSFLGMSKLVGAL